MANNADIASMALFCDFENVALGVRDAQYDKFDIRPVLERLLAKGSIVVKKAYCDWDRYKSFKSAMHEANFELIEIPHVRQSGKNSADIRMVVDALDLCYTKAHVDTFVIISGDSDFSPLVSKLRENAKRVIGVGVKQSCSDLLVTNCDEFIYYDDLVRDREARRPSQRREREPGKRSPEEEAGSKAKVEERKSKAVDLVAATFADLMADRGESERIWASVLKEVVKRRNPGFSESYYGFRSFGNLLEEAASRGLIGFGRDDKSGAYVTRVLGRAAPHEAELPVATETPAVEPAANEDSTAAPGEAAPAGQSSRRRGGRRTRKETEARGGEMAAPETVQEEGPEVPVTPVAEAAMAPEAPEAPLAAQHAAQPATHGRQRSRGGRRPRPEAEARPAAAPMVETQPAVGEAAVPPEAPAATPGKARGGRRPRKETAASAPAVDAAPVATPVAAEAPAPVKKPRQPRSRKPKAAAE